MTTLVYDGDCAFCTSSVRLMQRLHLQADVVIPYQHADLAKLGLTEQQCREEVQYVDVHGYISGGHVAIAHLMQDGPLVWRVVGRAMMLPGANFAAGMVYRFIANNRNRLPGGTPACAVRPDEKP